MLILPQTVINMLDFNKKNNKRFDLSQIKCARG